MAGPTVHLNAPGGDPLPRVLLERAVRATLPQDPASEVSVTFLRDEPMRKLNLQYLDRPRPTDVLAFALHEEGAPVVGDVYVGIEQARRQAAEAGVPLDQELVRLAIHGTLHVLGYDHPDAPEERAGSEQYIRQETLVRKVMAEHGGRAPSGPDASS